MAASITSNGWRCSILTKPSSKQKPVSHTLPRKSPDQETSDLCVAAFQDLCAGRHIDVSKIDCIVVCTQNPDSDGIPHVSAIVHGKLGLSETCASFDISLGCSGYVYGLSLVSSFMEANDLRKGLFFTADPYSKIIDMNDKNTSLLLGTAPPSVS